MKEKENEVMDFIKRTILWVLSILGVAFFMVCTLISTVLGNKNSTAKCGNWMRGQWYLFIEEPTVVLHWLSGWRSGLVSRFNGWRAARAEKKAAKLKLKAEAAEAAKLKADKAKEAKKAKGHWFQRFVCWSGLLFLDALEARNRRVLSDYEFVGMRMPDGEYIPVQPGQMPEAVSSDIADGDEGGDCDEEFLIETEPVDPLGDTDEVLAVVTLHDEDEGPFGLPTETDEMRTMLEQVAQVSEFRLAGMSLTWQEQLKLWSHICRDRNKSDRSKLAVQEALTKEVESWTGDEGSAQQSIRANLSIGRYPEFP
jgi:hypothetical protein